MKLKTLLLDGCFDICGEADTEISGIALDNRKIDDGYIFFAIKGYIKDGNSFAPDSIVKGAVAIATDSEDSLRKYVGEAGMMMSDKGIEYKDRCVTVVKTDDIRKLFAHACAAFYSYPSESMDVVGITGTKGKTTTSYMLRSIYSAENVRSGLIGTICNYIGDDKYDTDRTTPDADIIQELLSRMLKKDICKCVMEVSSQGLHLDRVYDVHFKYAIFTNLTKDHIGENEHHSMEEYASAKAKLFSMCDYAIINADSDHASFMKDRCRCKGVYTYAIDSDCDFKAINIVKTMSSVEYDVVVKNTNTFHVFVPIPGRFTVYNSLSAFAASYLSGVDAECIKKGLASVFVPGKAETVPTGRDFSILIDYAHNPDSFINILSAVREYAKRTVFLFGCGGDRNRPRALMGKTAGENADFTIITSDNPRSEDPASIIRDIEEGIKETKKPYICIVDRTEAIAYAITHAQPGDVIILAGKGHETEQIFKDRTIHYDEREVVRSILENMKGDHR